MSTTCAARGGAAPVRAALAVAAMMALLATPDAARAATRRVPSAYATITLALGAAAPGDTVLVAPGVYHEDVLLPTGVTLISEGGPLVTTITTTPPHAAVGIYGGDAATRLAGFTLSGSQDGIVVSGGSPVVENNIFRENVVAGVDLVGGTQADVRGNLIIDNPLNGVLIDPATPVNLRQNTIVRNRRGIAMGFAAVPVIEANIVALNTEYGVLADQSAPVFSCNDVWANATGYSGMTDPTGTGGNIAADPLFCDRWNAVWTLRTGSPCAPGAGGCAQRGAYGLGCAGRHLRVDPAGAGDATTIQGGVSLAQRPDTVDVLAGDYTESVTITSSIALRGTSPGSTVVTSPGTQPALRVAGASAAADSGVLVSSLTLSAPAGTALSVESGAIARLRESAAAASSVGIRATGAAVILDRATVARNTGDGVRAETGAGVTLSRSIVAANGGAGVRVSGGSASVLCTDTHGNVGGNYAGMADPTGTAGDISLDPLFCDASSGRYTLRAGSPCAGGGCGARGAFGVGCAARVWDVNTTGSGDAPTIQAAIDSSIAPDTVRVAAGTYHEAVVLRNGLVLEGTSIVTPPRIARSGAWDGLRMSACDSTTLVRRLRLSGFIGSGVTLENAIGARIDSCVLDSNGAGIVAVAGTVRLAGDIFNGNTIGLTVFGANVIADASTWYRQGGSGVFVDDAGRLTLSHAIVASGTGAGIEVSSGGTVFLSCNDVWGNAGGNYVGTAPGAGDFSADPRFCDAASGVFTLDTQSPCTPAHSGGCGLVGARDAACGAGTSVAGAAADPDRRDLVLRLRPNPFHRAGWLDIGGAGDDAGMAGEVTLALYDVNGRRIWEGRVVTGPGGRGDASMSWPPPDMPRLETGIYFLRARDRERSAVVRLVIAH